MEESKTGTSRPMETGSFASSSSAYVASRDHQSIEVFNPSNFYQSSVAGQMELESRIDEGSARTASGRELVDKWMAFPANTEESKDVDPSTEYIGSEDCVPVDSSSNGHSGKTLTEAIMAERAADWGLVVKPENVGENQTLVLGSSEEKGKTSSIESSDSERSSIDGQAFPRFSKELKDALSTLQQTFVVSDATQFDYPIIYASAGFFSMTGYSSKEVIGRNWYLLPFKTLFHLLHLRVRGL